jgi:hypothetical protein
MDDRLSETMNKLVNFCLKEYWESITLYGQRSPPPEKPWIIVGYPENLYSRGLVELIKEKNARRGPAESS